jgi:hypothetical protein
MFDHFYHEIFRKTIVAFGTLFNGITIHRTEDSSGKIDSIIKVPLAYGPTQKFLARLEQEPDLNKPVQITLPRMSFEFIGLNYDPTRKLAATQSFSAAIKTNNTDIRKTYMPVPYNMEFELSIMTLINDDMLQIVEQILPYFQPSYNLTIDLISTIGEKRDIPITLENIGMQDNYEGDYTTRRSLIYTLKFVAKTYLFGPISGSDSTKDIIKKVSIGLAGGEYSGTSSRNVIYSSEAKATKNYTGNITTYLSSDIELKSPLISVEDSTNIPANSYITINDETLYVKSKTNNDLTVVRGYYSTTASDHVAGSAILLITTADNALIPFGDDFGFDGEING